MPNQFWGVLPEKPNFGLMLGQGLSQGIGQGVNVGMQIRQQKQQQAQFEQQMAFKQKQFDLDVEDFRMRMQKHVREADLADDKRREAIFAKWTPSFIALSKIEDAVAQGEGLVILVQNPEFQRDLPILIPGKDFSKMTPKAIAYEVYKKVAKPAWTKALEEHRQELLRLGEEKETGAYGITKGQLLAEQEMGVGAFAPGEDTQTKAYETRLGQLTAEQEMGAGAFALDEPPRTELGETIVTVASNEETYFESVLKEELKAAGLDLHRGFGIVPKDAPSLRFIQKVKAGMPLSTLEDMAASPENYAEQYPLVHPGLIRAVTATSLRVGKRTVPRRKGGAQVASPEEPEIIRVRHKATGNTGIIPADRFDEGIWEKL